MNDIKGLTINMIEVDYECEICEGLGCEDCDNIGYTFETINAIDAIKILSDRGDIQRVEGDTEQYTDENGQYDDYFVINNIVKII